MEEKRNEASIKRGICPDCGKPMRTWSDAEIAEAKADIGMGNEDDFHDCCAACATTYQAHDCALRRDILAAQAELEHAA